MKILNLQNNLEQEKVRKEIVQTEAALLQQFNTIKELFSVERIVTDLKKIIPEWVYRPVFLGVLVGLFSISLILRILFPSRPRIIIQNPYAYPLMESKEKESRTPSTNIGLYPSQEYPSKSKSSFVTGLLKTTLETLILHFLKIKLIQFLDKYSNFSLPKNKHEIPK